MYIDMSIEDSSIYSPRSTRSTRGQLAICRWPWPLGQVSVVQLSAVLVSDMFDETHGGKSHE